MKSNLMRLLSVSGMAVVIATSAAQEDHRPGNAALLYWQAFDAMPQEADIPGELWERELPARAVAFLDDAPPSLDLLHEAVSATGCDWGISWTRGPATLLPHLGKGRGLARLACLRARCSLARGNTTGAARDLLAVLTLARHLGQDGPLISLLVQTAVEGMAVEGIARHFGQWSTEDLGMLDRGFDSLPPRADFAAAMRVEKRSYGDWLKQSITRINTNGALDDALNNLLTVCEPNALKGVGQLNGGRIIGLTAQIAQLDDVHYRELVKIMRIPPDRADLMAPLQAVETMVSAMSPDGRENVTQLIKTVAEAKARALWEGASSTVADLVADLDANYRELVRVASLPYGAWRTEAPRFEESLKTAGPLSQQLLPAIFKGRERAAMGQARSAMLRAAVVLRLKGEDAFSQVRDPFGNGPFGLAVEGETMVLSSGLEAGNTPVTLQLANQTEAAIAASAPEAETLSDVPERARVEKLLADLQRFTDPTGDVRAGIARDVRNSFEQIGRRVPGIEVTEIEEQDLIDLSIDGLMHFSRTWVPILQIGLASDSSARRAAVMLSNQDLQAATMRYTLIRYRDEIIRIIGEEHYAAVAALLP